MALQERIASPEESKDPCVEDALEERRKIEAIAGTSERPVPAPVLRHATNNAIQHPGETWDEEKFKRKKPELCMLETSDVPGLYCQGYFCQWSTNEAQVRVPFEERPTLFEWVNLKSSRIWRGHMGQKFWTHLGKGKWTPKGQAGRKKKADLQKRAKGKVKAEAENSEDQQDASLALLSLRQGSMNTMSTSIQTPNSGSNQKRDNGDEGGPEISSSSQATDLQEATKRQACNVEANVESSGQEQCHEFFLDWQRVHFQSLAQQGLLNLPIAENCNWESGNLKALQSQAEDKGGLDSHSSAKHDQPTNLVSNLRQTIKASTDISQGNQHGPPSPSPSTPHKRSRDFRRQNSSSEEFDLRSGAHHDKTGAKHVLNPKSLSVSSPRSIGNLRSQNDAKTSDAWKEHGKLGQISAQNSGSSSSSGKVPNDSPNTVLPHSLEGEGMNGKDFRIKSQRPHNHESNVADRRKSSEDGPALPLKKRSKVALVETDPFAID